jgi:ribonuclease HI
MATEAPHYIVTFDGGSRGNPGQGYGSYELRTCDDRARIERREYGEAITNNEAEYRTLIEAFRDLLATLRAAGKDPSTYRVRVQGDSQLVIRQLNGQYQVKHAAMQTLYGQVIDLARQLGAVEYIWHRREHSVRTLGH